jgi:SMC interacting uncharacterized protein involved in chromosome segregation
VPQRSSLKEIEVQIQIARDQFRRLKKLLDVGAVDHEKYRAPLDQIRLLIARLEGMDDDFADELERLKVEIVKKEAELKLAEAQRGVTAANMALYARLNNRKPGMVAAEEVAKDESEHASTSAKVQVKQAEIQEVRLKLSQLMRRREMIKRTVNGVLKAIPELAREVGPALDAGDITPLQR